MALFGTLDTVRRQAAPADAFAAAFAYAADILDPASVAGRRLASAAVGSSNRIELAGGAFAIEAVYMTRPRHEGFFETHRKYIDVQLIVAGEEIMEVEAAARLAVSAPYNAERDFTKYADTPAASVLRLCAGDVAVFYPKDAHMPSLQVGGHPTLVRKSVVKVPVA